MSDRLIGKRCLVTGGARGIGRSIVERFIAEGAHVIAADLAFDTGDALGQERLVLDVTDPDAVSRAATGHPDVDILVNCAGYVAAGNVLDTSVEELDRSWTVNVKSMALTIRNFLPLMIERRSGAIVNIASVVSTVKSAPDRFAYAASKAAVIGLTMSVARDFIGKGVRCNAISPGTVDSPSLEARLAATGDVEAARAAFIARQPMGRLGRPDEIAAIAVLLASDEAPFMTGANIVVDGGMAL